MIQPQTLTAASLLKAGPTGSKTEAGESGSKTPRTRRAGRGGGARLFFGRKEGSEFRGRFLATRRREAPVSNPYNSPSIEEDYAAVCRSGRWSEGVRAEMGKGAVSGHFTAGAESGATCLPHTFTQARPTPRSTVYAVCVCSAEQQAEWERGEREGEEDRKTGKRGGKGQREGGEGENGMKRGREREATSLKQHRWQLLKQNFTAPASLSSRARPTRTPARHSVPGSSSTDPFCVSGSAPQGRRVRQCLRTACQAGGGTGLAQSQGAQSFFPTHTTFSHGHGSETKR